MAKSKPQAQPADIMLASLYFTVSSQWNGRLSGDNGEADSGLSVQDALFALNKIKKATASMVLIRRAERLQHDIIHNQQEGVA